MAKYMVKKIYQYTESIEVEADSESAAKDAAMDMEGDRNEDDHLYDCVIVRKISDDV